MTEIHVACDEWDVMIDTGLSDERIGETHTQAATEHLRT
jgi:hypothetical protein